MARKAFAAAASLLLASSAFAATYEVSADYRGSFCNSIRDALAADMLLDANKPLCERRFDLSPRAKRFGLSSVQKTLLPKSHYADLLREMVPLAGHGNLTQPDADRVRNQAAIKRLIRGDHLKIYLANFDADNSGENRTVYIEDYVLCDDLDSSSETNPSIFIMREDGTFDPAWDGRYANGSPFIYNGKTYYARWQTLRGSAVKNGLAQLDIYESWPFNSTHSHGAVDEGFPPSYCEIYQNQNK